MNSKKAAFTFQNVILVADQFSEGSIAPPVQERRDLEMSDVQTIALLKAEIESFGLNVHLVAGPEELAKSAPTYQNCIVLSIFGGASSRNRMALVPAVCEAFGLRFIGPDVYGRIVAQDKEISKRLAMDHDLLTPKWRVVRNTGDLSFASGLSFPLVVKPLLEGSSIGISQKNLVKSQNDADSLAEELLQTFEQPVIFEEFVPGREVAYCSIQTKEDKHWSFSEVVIESKRDFFLDHLFDADEKMAPTAGRTVLNIDNNLDEMDRAKINALLSSFGTYGYCRVDGRMNNGRFHFLELTPDAWIAPRGQFAKSFTEKGWSYGDVVRALLSSAN